MAAADGPAADEARVVVVADDLIWAERLAGIVRAIGRRPTVVRSLDALRAAAGGGAPVVVDLTARAYDGLGAVEAARAAGSRVLAVAQHDDLELHRRARAAGAERVVAYRLVHERGVAVVGAWLAGGAPAVAASELRSGR